MNEQYKNVTMKSSNIDESSGIQLDEVKNEPKR